MGRKPLAFLAWLFDLLGMQPGDELVDLFPGTGVVGQAWASLSAPADASPPGGSDASPRSSTTSPGDGGHASVRYLSDAIRVDGTSAGAGSDAAAEYSDDEVA